VNTHITEFTTEGTGLLGIEVGGQAGGRERVAKEGRYSVPLLFLFTIKSRF